jgi:hypothetical protein
MSGREPVPVLTLPTQLRVRASTGPPPGSGPNE